MVTQAIVIAAVLTLLPLLAAAFFGEGLANWVEKASPWLRLIVPAVLCVPYVVVTASTGSFRWGWFGLYLLLPVAVAGLLWLARRADPEQQGDWRDLAVLGVLGLAVDLRWEVSLPAYFGVPLHAF